MDIQKEKVRSENKVVRYNDAFLGAFCVAEFII